MAGTSPTIARERTLRRPTLRSTRGAVLLALVSTAAFGTSGVFGRALFDGGWSPAAAVTARIAIAALVLAVPTAHALRGRWHLLRRHIGTVVLYGMTGVAGCQLFYFVAVEHLSVGVALLLEYLSPVLLVLWTWATTHHRPGRLTVAGTGCALAGLALVLDVLGEIDLDAVGVAFGLASALCSAAYFVVAGRTPDDALPPIALAGAGMAAGLVPLLLVGVLGLLPMRASTQDVVLAGREVSVVVPVLGIAVLAAAFAYVTGVVSARRLGSRLASFVALSEVVFAVLFAWWFLGELLLPVQIAGGVLILAGVLLVRASGDDVPH